MEYWNNGKMGGRRQNTEVRRRETEVRRTATAGILEEWNGGRMGKEGYWILDPGYWMPKEWERRRIHPPSLYELWRGKGDRRQQ